MLGERVGGHRPKAPGVRDDRDAGTDRQAPGVEHLRGVEQVADLAHPQDADALERGLVDLVATPERAGGQQRRSCALRVASRLQDDDRLVAREARAALMKRRAFPIVSM